MTATQPYILLVDDHPQNLYLMSEVLESEGYTVRQVESGPDALAAIRMALPQLILLDVMMPDMDGFEVCKAIRRNAQTAAIPIIFLTALDDDASHLKSLEVIGDDYLTKPIDVQLVLKKITRTLTLQQLREAQHQQQLTAKTQELQSIQDQHRRQMMAAWQISETLAEKFYSFVPRQFLTRVAPRGVESLEVGTAKESEMTVLFCDIRDFTAIAEQQAAQATFKWLNVFFESINQAVTTNHGFIDKYLGDAVMAVFDRDGCHAWDALQATDQIDHSLEQFNRDRQAYALKRPIRIGVGVHSGMGLIGTVGANQRMDTTVVGDVVNTASRLENMTKLYQCPVVLSEQVIEHLPANHPFKFGWLDQVVPRGKQSALNIYRLHLPAESRPASRQTSIVD